MTESEFLTLVQLNRHLGFGRMIQIIAYEWFHTNEGQGYDRAPVEGVPYALADGAAKWKFDRLLKVDPLASKYGKDL